MNLTTAHVIKTLPFEESFKQELLAKLPGLNELVKYEVVEMLWDLYYEIYEARFQENVDKAFEKASKNEETLDGTFYKRIAEQTVKEMQQNTLNTSTEVDLSTTRQKLQEILQNTPDSSQTGN